MGPWVCRTCPTARLYFCFREPHTFRDSTKVAHVKLYNPGKISPTCHLGGHCPSQPTQLLRTGAHAGVLPPTAGTQATCHRSSESGARLWGEWRTILPRRLGPAWRSSLSKGSGLLYLFLLQEAMKVSDGSLLGDPGRTPLSKKEGVKWQRPRLTRQALMRCCLVKWILSSAAPQGSGRGWGGLDEGRGGGGVSVWSSLLSEASEATLGPQPRPCHLHLCWEIMFSFIHAFPH